MTTGSEGLAAALLAALVLAGCAQVGAPDASLGAAAATTLAAGACHLRDGAYPDHNCNPGAVSPRVSQANLAQTVCSTTRDSGRSWTQRERDRWLPNSAARKRQMLAAYGIPVGDSARYELDHVVPIGVGGDPAAVANTAPESWDGPHGAHAKDAVEARAHRDLCAGRITLAQAQGLFLGGQW